MLCMHTPAKPKIAGTMHIGCGRDRLLRPVQSTGLVVVVCIGGQKYICGRGVHSLNLSFMCEK